MWRFLKKLFLQKHEDNQSNTNTIKQRNKYERIHELRQPKVIQRIAKFDFDEMLQNDLSNIDTCLKMHNDSVPGTTACDNSSPSEDGLFFDQCLEHLDQFCAPPEQLHECIEIRSSREYPDPKQNTTDLNQHGVVEIEKLRRRIQHEYNLQEIPKPVAIMKLDRSVETDTELSEYMFELTQPIQLSESKLIQRYAVNLNNQVFASEASESKELIAEQSLNNDKIRCSVNFYDQSIKLMREYPIGYVTYDRDNDNSFQNVLKPPSKQRFNNEMNQIDELKKPSGPLRDESKFHCYYNIWVPECLRAFKDFLSCRALSLSNFDSEQSFKHYFHKHGFVNTMENYSIYKNSDKQSTPGVIPKIERKFPVEVDVTDSFDGLNGVKLRIYSIQGNSKNVVYSAFKFFEATWTANYFVHYITLFNASMQPKHWLDYIIMKDNLSKLKDEAPLELYSEELWKESPQHEDTVSYSQTTNSSNIATDFIANKKLVYSGKAKELIKYFNNYEKYHSNFTLNEKLSFNCAS